MTSETPELINPFAREEDPGDPSPPLECRHEVECDCHVDVDGSEEMFRRFRQRLDAVHDLQHRGLFVAVHGATGCGKTSLVNRCAAWAERTLDTRTDTCALIDLRRAGLIPQSVDDRIRQVGIDLTRRVMDNDQLRGSAGSRDRITGNLYQVTSELTQRLRDKATVIMLLPPTEHLTEIKTYWASTAPKFLAIAECTTSLHISDFRGQGAVHTLLLEMGILRPGDSVTFGKARVGRPGRGTEFPDLGPDALEALKNFVGPGITISTIQALLYGAYEKYCTSNRMPDGNIIRESDLARLMELEG